MYYIGMSTIVQSIERKYANTKSFDVESSQIECAQLIYMCVYKYTVYKIY